MKYLSRRHIDAKAALAIEEAKEEVALAEKDRSRDMEEVFLSQLVEDSVNIVSSEDKADHLMFIYITKTTYESNVC